MNFYEEEVALLIQFQSKSAAGEQNHWFKYIYLIGCPLAGND
jgi:hypothetical protein